MLERLIQLDTERHKKLLKAHLIGRLDSKSNADEEDEQVRLIDSKCDPLVLRRVSDGLQCLSPNDERVISGNSPKLERRISHTNEGMNFKQSPPLPYARHVNFKWQIGRKLGSGTFGDVYEAVRLDTHESVVVKCIKRKCFANDRGQNDFWNEDLENLRETLREFDLFVSLNHPNLVRYHGIEASRYELLIFMERCPGRTLANMVNQELVELMIRKYANKLLQAIAYLHERNIIHRDIKPDNIMLCEPSDPNILKLTDFGSATRIQHNFGSVRIRVGASNVPSSHQRLNCIGLVDGLEGTPAYMAPEVCRGECYDVKCDIWSFGCVIWELFEGKRPHHEKTNSSQIIWKMAQLKYDAEALYRPKRASDDSWKFIRSCIQVDPSMRTSAVNLLRTDFVKVVVSSAVPSTPSLWYRASTIKRHHKPSFRITSSLNDRISMKM